MARDIKITNEQFQFLEEKEQKEAKFCFAKGLNKLEQKEAVSPNKIKRIERRFIKDSDSLGNIIANIQLRLKNASYDNLLFAKDILESREQRLYGLAQEYSKIMGDETWTHPNYEKYLNLYEVIYEWVESEILARNIGRREE